MRQDSSKQLIGNLIIAVKNYYGISGGALSEIHDAQQKLEARIVELETAGRWIPIEEQMPKCGQTVYGWIHPVPYIPGNEKEMTYMPMLNADYPWRSTWDMATYSILDVTHWRPMVAPPKVDHE